MVDTFGSPTSIRYCGSLCHATAQSPQCGFHPFWFLVKLVTELDTEGKREIGWVGLRSHTIHSLVIHLTYFIMFLLGAYPGPWDTAGNKTEEVLVPMEHPLQWKQILIQLFLIYGEKEMGLNWSRVHMLEESFRK